MLTDLDHIGIAVVSLDKSVERYRAALGCAPHHSETIEKQGVREVLFATGSSFIQLLEPLGPDTPVGKFIAKRGPGLHHVGYRVSDILAVLGRLKSEGIRLIDDVPRIGSMGNAVAFVHPKEFDGALIELVQQKP